MSLASAAITPFASEAAKAAFANDGGAPSGMGGSESLATANAELQRERSSDQTPTGAVGLGALAGTVIGVLVLMKRKR